jgi:NadR type nicotinamide-nucleotide adenylyltransferase
MPCSGTLIRNDPHGCWEWIDPPVRAWYAKRVCILGAESTGTTTLARDLAAALDTVWVPEYGRELSEIKAAKNEWTWVTAEFHDIAREQTRRENAAARLANKILVCDTNAFATCLWHRRYMGCDDPALWDYAAQGRCDLYILTGDEIPFVQDGLRDGEHIRHHMQQEFRDALARQSVPWHEVRGGREERLATALRLIRDLSVTL